MSDRRLQVFHAVARHLSFTRAAEALHMTQPAVTFQVRQLEEHFNTRLFDRGHNRITLTDAGRRVFDYAERILDLHARMESDVRALTGEVSGVLMVGASTTIAEYLLPSLLGEFARRYPSVRLSLRVSNTEGIVRLVEDNDIDLGVVEGPVQNGQLAVEECMQDGLVAVMAPGHPLARRAHVDAAELLAHPFIAREEGSGTREVVLDYLRQTGHDPDALDIALELGSPESIKGAVAAGMGISVLSRSTLAKELALGSLCEAPLEPPLARPFSFVHRRQKSRTQAMQKLLEEARAWFALQAPAAATGASQRARQLAEGA